MKPFEELCEDLRAFALAHPDERDVLMSDSAIYGGGMDASVAILKMKALTKYAREYGLTLYIENRADDWLRVRPPPP